MHSDRKPPRSRPSALLAALAFLALAACSDNAPPPVAGSAATGGDAALEQRIGVLPPQQLPPGRCGMFLWSKTAQPKLVFYSQDGGTGAKMSLDNEPVQLVRTAAEGEAYFGQFEQQSFAVGDYQVEVTVQVQRRAGVIGGAIVERGALRLSQADGWEVVLPVAGLIACQMS